MWSGARTLVDMSTSWTLNISRVMLITRMNFMITVLKQKIFTIQYDRDIFFQQNILLKGSYIFTVFKAHTLHIFNHKGYQCNRFRNYYTYCTYVWVWMVPMDKLHEYYTVFCDLYMFLKSYSYNQVGIFLLLGLQYQSKDFKPQQQHFISQYFLSFFS